MRRARAGADITRDRLDGGLMHIFLIVSVVLALGGVGLTLRFVVFGTEFLMRIAQGVEFLAQTADLTLINTKLSKDVLPEGWGLVEVGEVVHVHGPYEGEYEVTRVEDDGQIWLGLV